MSGLKTRSRNVLRKLGVTELEKLDGFSVAKLLDVENSGASTVIDVQTWLRSKYVETGVDRTLKIDANSHKYLCRALRAQELVTNLFPTVSPSGLPPAWRLEAGEETLIADDWTVTVTRADSLCVAQKSFSSIEIRVDPFDGMSVYSSAGLVFSMSSNAFEALLAGVRRAKLPPIK